VKSETNDLQQIFQDRRQYRVPFYQRAYVWSKEEQWEPLWNDIRDKAEARLNGQPPAPHFLGAIVLEPQERRGLCGVETYHIIDGQQRLTTLQYFLAAMSMAIRDDARSAILTLIEGCLWNPNPDTMEQPEIERFKVWPTFRDREDYRLAMEADGRDALRERFRSSFTQTDTLKRIGIDHPPALEAIWFFNDQIETWLASSQNGNDHRVEWLEALAEAALRDLKLVAISLDKDDDAGSKRLQSWEWAGNRPMRSMLSQARNDHLDNLLQVGDRLLGGIAPGSPAAVGECRAVRVPAVLVMLDDNLERISDHVALLSAVVGYLRPLVSQR
jgi:hypothetical protein